ncbi:hypothetical protein [Variovorax sp. Sphag1AA]|uniref:hypothetical protein n=1 Tax=Variovorax sp. Sphag1AA TaxID=2587027 RepID=UPI001612F4D1|nr:hypothetical protein [Variovorax sp. Sphag1AA]MBB3175902.1 hypothetical protein [Variovorax sp. Sphag1AA]
MSKPPAEGPAEPKSKRATYAPVPWIDERIPDTIEHMLPPEVDASDFTPWLKSRLGEYRHWLEFAKGNPSTLADEIAHVVRNRKALEDALPALNRDAYSADTMAELRIRTAGTTALDFDECLKLGTMALVIAIPALRKREETLGTLDAKRGRRKQAPRDKLMLDVFERLGGMPRHRKLVVQILEACGVRPLVTDPKELRELLPASSRKKQG